jgi:hypothetical protein
MHRNNRPAQLALAALPLIAFVLAVPAFAQQTSGTTDGSAAQTATSQQTAVDAPAAPPSQSPAALPKPTAATASSTAEAQPTAQSQQLASLPAYAPDADGEAAIDHLGSTYIPVDSPVYPMILRLYSMGYLDTAFINMRPWTRRVLLHALVESSPRIMADGNDEAIALLARLHSYIEEEGQPTNNGRGTVYGLESAYTRFLGISGQTLRDSYHLGETINNDYGRPYEPGFNNITGFSTVNEYGRFSLYVRGEYEHSPAGTGYSTVDTGNPLAPGGLVYTLSYLDQIPYPGVNNYNANQATIPTGAIAAQNPFRLQEASLSFHLLGHEISGGKSDYWVGPAAGGGMAWSNNAEDIYSFRIDRVEPAHVPYLKFLGLWRWDFFVGSLKGHTEPNSPYVHSETVSGMPTSNFQFGFTRTVIWGGHGHQPVTLHTFLHTFFSLSDTQENPNSKNSPDDPGARFSEFNFAWRLPFLRHYVTLYTDSIAHDDVSPISAPRRAAYRPGVYISQFPGLPKLDFRIEAASTDTSTLRSLSGQFNYYEAVQRQGYTNKGAIMGDWIGREAKGGQAWLTYHLGPDEYVQLQYLNKKTPKDFINGGTTQDQFIVDVVKNIHRDVQLNAWLQVERWKAPIYIMNANNAPNHDTTIAAQLTWYPKLKTKRDLTGR